MRRFLAGFGAGLLLVSLVFGYLDHREIKRLESDYAECQVGLAMRDWKIGSQREELNRHMRALIPPKLRGVFDLAGP